MQESQNRLLLLIGSVAFIVLVLWQMLVYWANVEFSLLVSILLLVQAALAAPVLLHALGIMSIPLQRYTLAFAVLVGVLAIDGHLGMPPAWELDGAQRESTRLAVEENQVRIEQGAQERLELQVDLAAAESDERKKEIRDQINKVGDDFGRLRRGARAREPRRGGLRV